MNDIAVLLKIDLINSLKLNAFKQKGERKKHMTMAVMFLFVGIMCIVYVGAGTWFLADVMIEMNLSHLIPVLSFMSSFSVLMLLNITKMPSVLFSFKDYNILVPLPIKDKDIFMAKLFRLLMDNFLWQILTGLPIFLVYAIKSPDFSPLSAFIYLAIFIVTPFIPVVISSLFAFLIAAVSVRMKNKNTIIIIGSIILIVAIMLLSFSTQKVFDEQVIMQTVTGLSETLSTFFVFNLYTDAVVNLNVQSIFLLLMLFVAPFLLFVHLFSKSFKKINAYMGETRSSKNSKDVTYSENSPVFAVFKKELIMYFKNPLYFLNTFIGMVMLVMFSVAVIFTGPDMLSKMMIPVDTGFSLSHINLFLGAVVFSFCIIMTSPLSVNISLEGKNIWISKSLPITTADLFKGKLLLGIVLSLPITFVCTFVYSIAMSLSIVQLSALLLLSLSLCLFTQIAGLWINLLLPKTQFKSQVEVIKQSASVMVAVLGGMALVSIMTALIFSFGVQNIVLFMFFTSALFCILSLLIYLHTMAKGVKRFETL